MSLLRWTPLILAVASVLACQTQGDAFYDSVFPCSIAATTDQCGTTKSGRPMTCYPGSQLGGGSDFCAEACDPDAGVAETGHVCLASGALLVSCTPDPPPGRPNGCPAKLNCYRTDVLSNTGVCLMMRVCTADSDCTESQRPKCVATIIHQLEPAITTDNLECVQAMCASSGSSCPAGESCSADYYDTPNLTDICLPNCLGNGVCPPNFACAATPAALGSPSICLPGVPGERCNYEEDCIVGDCLDTGAGFKECILTALGCAIDLDCGPIDNSDDTFACANGRCIGVSAFHGTSCISDSDCTAGQRCIRYSPYGSSGDKGECRPPCDADLTCPPRGGVPQVCLDGGAGGCYPGDFALPCTASSQCLSEFACTAVSPDPRTIIDSPTICTTDCLTDDDCQSNPLIRQGGFCEEGVCRLVGQAGDPCDRDAECISGVCAYAPVGLSQCVSVS